MMKLSFSHPFGPINDLLWAAVLILSPAQSSFAKDTIYFTKNSASAPTLRETNFAPGEPIYAWVQLERPSSPKTEDFNIRYRYPLPNGQSQGKMLKVPRAFLQNFPPHAPLGQTRGFGFWLVPSAAKAKEGMDPDNFLSAMAELPAGVQTVTWEGFNAHGTLKYDARAGQSKILQQMTEVQLNEELQLSPATQRGSPEEADLVKLIKSSPDFRGETVTQIRFTGPWSQTTRDSNLVMMRFADSQVAASSPNGQHCSLWNLQVKQDPGGLTIFRSHQAAVACIAIK